MNSDRAATVTALLQSHRSIRRFTTQEVDMALIDQVLEDAHAGSSSSSNLSQIAVIRTRDPVRRAKLSALHFGQQMVLQAPLVLTFCADVYRTRQWLAQRQVRNNFDNLLGFQTAAIDAVIMAQSTALLLESHGLGICYMGSTLHAAKEIADFLALPPHSMPIVSMVVGWPAEQPPARKRLSSEAWIHDECYRAHSADDIDRLYTPHEQREWAGFNSINQQISARLAEMNIDSMAKYITSDMGYSPAIFTRDSKRYLQLLQEKGFIPSPAPASARQAESVEN
ncbi:nitroreductase family protein [Chitinimonas sp.]|uniref:nitroreductase family protein n=1 Tax=Chitinimonas sp. TaxID=1934313 RepID=UPI0035B04324